jgi:hypothetical protein
MAEVLQPAHPPKKPRFWRVHLSTALIAVFVAAGLSAANFLARTTPCGWGDGQLDYYWGFPFDAAKVCGGAGIAERANEDDPTVYLPKGRANPFQWWRRDAVAYNAAICCAIVMGIVVVCEWLVRRREPQT